MNPKHPPGPPMRLANLYEQGVHHLIAYCLNDACRHTGLIDVSSYPAWTEVPSFQRRAKVRELRQAHRRAAELEGGARLN